MGDGEWHSLFANAEKAATRTVATLVNSIFQLCALSAVVIGRPFLSRPYSDQNELPTDVAPVAFSSDC